MGTEGFQCSSVPPLPTCIFSYPDFARLLSSGGLNQVGKGGGRCADWGGSLHTCDRTGKREVMRHTSGRNDILKGQQGLRCLHNEHLCWPFPVAGVRDRASSGRILHFSRRVRG